MPKPTGAVYLCENAIIDNSYSNTIDFKNPSEQLKYWGSLVKYTVTDFMYIRRTRSYIKVAKSLTELDSINYLYFRAEEDARLYYCFVTGKEYISDSASYIYFETDVMQSYMFDYELKQSYVLQEHCDRWTADHKPIFSRTEEGLDYGSEYTVEEGYNVRSKTESIYSKWYLAVLKQGYTTAGGRSSTPTEVGAVANPYTYLLIPEETAYLRARVHHPDKRTGGHVDVSISGIQVFNFIMAKSEESIGSFVQQIVRLPYLPFDFEIGKLPVSEENTAITVSAVDVTKDPSRITYTGFSYVGAESGTANFLVIDYYSNRSKVTSTSPANKEYHRKLASMDFLQGLENSVPTAEQWADIKANPYNVERDKRFESKLLCYPYRYNILTDWKNQPAIIKNEYISGDKIQINYVQSIGVNAPARYWVDKYKKDIEGRNTSVVQPMQEDVPVVTSEYYTYMLQNRNQLQADRSNLQASNETSEFLSIANGILGVASNTGNTAGMIKSAGSGYLGYLGTSMTNDTNYANLIRSQNAKQKDLKNLPQNVVSGNDTAFSIFDDNLYLSFYRMKVCCEFEELLADTFATSGYTVKRIKLPNLRSRLRYNYIKTVGANVVGSFNQDDLAKIRAIFDNGITFWHYNLVNFKPYDYSLENIETSLI